MNIRTVDAIDLELTLVVTSIAAVTLPRRGQRCLSPQRAFRRRWCRHRCRCYYRRHCSPLALSVLLSPQKLVTPGLTGWRHRPYMPPDRRISVIVLPSCQSSIFAGLKTQNRLIGGLIYCHDHVFIGQSVKKVPPRLTHCSFPDWWVGHTMSYHRWAHHCSWDDNYPIPIPYVSTIHTSHENIPLGVEQTGLVPS